MITARTQMLMASASPKSERLFFLFFSHAMMNDFITTTPITSAWIVISCEDWVSIVLLVQISYHAHVIGPKLWIVYVRLIQLLLLLLENCH